MSGGDLANIAFLKIGFVIFAILILIASFIGAGIWIGYGIWG